MNHLQIIGSTLIFATLLLSSCSTVNIVKKQVFYGVDEICISNNSQTIKLFEIEESLKKLGFQTVFEYREKCIKRDATGRVLYRPRFQLLIHTRRLSSTYEIDAKIWDRRFGNFVAAATASEFVGLIGKSHFALDRIMKELILGTFPTIPTIPTKKANTLPSNNENFKIIQSQLISLKPKLQECYEDALNLTEERKEVPYGIVGSTFKINGNGKIADLTLYTDTTINNENFLTCLRQKLAEFTAKDIKPNTAQTKHLFRFFPIKKSKYTAPLI